MNEGVGGAGSRIDVALSPLTNSGGATGEESVSIAIDDTAGDAVELDVVKKKRASHG